MSAIGSGGGGSGGGGSGGGGPGGGGPDGSSDEAGGDGPAEPRRPRILPQRVTLQFAGPKLALPGEQPAEPLRLDTSEFEIPPEASGGSRAREGAAREGAARAGDPDAGRPSLELDLDGLEGAGPEGAGPEGADPADPGAGAPDATDGWGRLRTGEAPRRGRSVTPRGEDALSLVSQRSRPPSTPGLDLASEMADRYALGDYTGALRVAELVLGQSPGDARAQKCAESSRERLIQLYSARLAAIMAPPSPGGAVGAAGGGLDTLGARVPRVQVPEHEIRWLGLDHRQGFLLSRLDGESSIEDLVDLSGMTRLEVLRTLVELVEVGAITIT